MSTATKTRPSEQKKDEPLKKAVRILVSELRVGDRIVTRWHGKKIGRGGISQEQANQMLDEFLETGESSWVAKSDPVKELEECLSKWRTHIHVNKRNCYDTRQYVWVVETKADRGE